MHADSGSLMDVQNPKKSNTRCGLRFFGMLQVWDLFSSSQLSISSPDKANWWSIKPSGLNLKARIIDPSDWQEKVMKKLLTARYTAEETNHQRPPVKVQGR